MSSRFRRPDTLLDMQGVADLLGVKYVTVRKWRERDIMPDPDYALAAPVWWQSTIVAWAKQTGRWEY